MMRSLLLGLKRYKVYPVDMFVELSFPFLMIIIVPSIWLWTSGLGDYSPRELFLYTAGSFFLSFLLGSLAFSIEKAIRTGYFEVYQTKPLHYGLHLTAQYYGEILPRLLVSVLILIAIYVHFGGKNLLLYLTGAALAVTFYTLLEMITGYLAAWYYKVWGIHFLLFYFPSLLFGGSIVPLDMLPKSIQAVSHFLPYRYLHYELARALLGYAPNIIPLLPWLIATLITERILYRKMLKRLEAWGG